MATFTHDGLTESTQIDNLSPANDTVLPPGLGPGQEEAVPFAFYLIAPHCQAFQEYCARGTTNVLYDPHHIQQEET